MIQIMEMILVHYSSSILYSIATLSTSTSRLGSYSDLAVVIGTVFWQVGITNSKKGITYDEINIMLWATSFLMNVSYILPFSTIPVFFADKKFFDAESVLGLYLAWIYGVIQVCT